MTSNQSSPPLEKSSLADIDVERIRKPVRTLFGWLIFRRISYHLSVRLARTRVTPLQITITGLLFGLSGAGLLTTGRRDLAIAGALLAWVAKVLDAADGEVARARHVETSSGYVLDGLTDRLRDTALLLGCGLGAANAGGAHALGWTLASVVGYLLFFYVSSAAPSHWREIQQESDLDEKHMFRVTRGIRLGAGDTIAVALLVAAVTGQLLLLTIAIAVLAPVAIVAKVSRLFVLRPWDGDTSRSAGRL